MKRFTDYFEYKEEQKELLAQALDMLTLVEKRASRIYREQRAHKRIDRQGLFVVSFPEIFSEIEDKNIRETVTIMGRSILQSGISLVCIDHIPQEKINIMLPISKPLHLWVSSRIVRKQKIMDEFWEYGVEFLARIDV